MPLTDKVYRIPRGLAHLVEAAVEQLKRDHDANALPPACYDSGSAAGWLEPVKVRVIIDSEEAP